MLVVYSNDEDDDLSFLLDISSIEPRNLRATGK